jgi:hypothetical protein
MGEHVEPHPEWSRTRRKQAEWNARRALNNWIDRYTAQLGEPETLGLVGQVIAERLKQRSESR